MECDGIKYEHVKIDVRVSGSCITYNPHKDKPDSVKPEECRVFSLMGLVKNGIISLKTCNEILKYYLSDEDTIISRTKSVLDKRVFE